MKKKVVMMAIKSVEMAVINIVNRSTVVMGLCKVTLVKNVMMGIVPRVMAVAHFVSRVVVMVKSIRPNNVMMLICTMVMDVINSVFWSFAVMDVYKSVSYAMMGIVWMEMDVTETV